MNNIFITCLLSIALIGCTGLPVPPAKYQPITTGILYENAERSSLSKVQGGPDKKLAIILSQNSKNSINFLIKGKKETIEMAEKYPSSKDSLLFDAEVDDPELFTKFIMKSLKNKFGKVTLLQSIASFNKGDYSALAIVDIYRVNDSNFFRTIVTSNIYTAFYDADIKFVNTVGASIKETMTHSTNYNPSEFSSQTYKINISSLEKWEAELDKVIAMPVQSAPKFDYDNCVREALSIKDRALKSQAMKFCSQEKTLK